MPRKGVSLWWLVLPALIVLFIVWKYNPLEAGFFPRCPSKLLTGYDCPGCGTTRALHALLHGDVGAAWHFNAAIFVAAPLVAILAVAPHLSDSNPLRRIARWKYLARTILAATIVWTIARNIHF